MFPALNAPSKKVPVNFQFATAYSAKNFIEEYEFMKMSRAEHSKQVVTTQSWISMGLLIKKKIVLYTGFFLWLTFLPLSGSAAAISFTPTLLGGNQWKYDYTVTAAVTDLTINEFTIFFDPTRYSNLVIAAAPLGWDPLIIQPDAGIPADGFFDALALANGISPSAFQGGFSVSFDFLGIGIPEKQRFDIVNPITFETVSTGFTSAAAITSDVPEPNALALVGLALALLQSFRRKLSSQKRNRQVENSKSFSSELGRK